MWYDDVFGGWLLGWACSEGVSDEMMLLLGEEDGKSGDTDL